MNVRPYVGMNNDSISKLNNIDKIKVDNYIINDKIVPNKVENFDKFFVNNNRDMSIEVQQKAKKEAELIQLEKNIKLNSNEYLTHSDRIEAQGIKNEQMDAIRNRVVEFAKDFVGNKYVYGGTSLINGIDCSAFTQAVYKEFGVNLPRNSKEQRNAGPKIDGLSSVKAGDLLCFPKHVALYAGEGKMIHAANERKGILYEDISPYWKNRLVSIVRPEIHID